MSIVLYDENDFRPFHDWWKRTEEQWMKGIRDPNVPNVPNHALGRTIIKDQAKCLKDPLELAEYHAILKYEDINSMSQDEKDDFKEVIRCIQRVLNESPSSNVEFSPCDFGQFKRTLVLANDNIGHGSRSWAWLNKRIWEQTSCKPIGMILPITRNIELNTEFRRVLFKLALMRYEYLKIINNHKEEVIRWNSMRILSKWKQGI